MCSARLKSATVLILLAVAAVCCLIPIARAIIDSGKTFVEVHGNEVAAARARASKPRQPLHALLPEKLSLKSKTGADASDAAPTKEDEHGQKGVDVNANTDTHSRTGSGSGSDGDSDSNSKDPALGDVDGQHEHPSETSEAGDSSAGDSGDSASECGCGGLDRAGVEGHTVGGGDDDDGSGHECEGASESSSGARSGSAEQEDRELSPRERHNAVYFEGGSFIMGTDYIGYPGGYKADGESPARKVAVSPFYLAQSETTNAQFREFVDATGFTSETEGFGFSFVFYQFLSQKQLDEIDQGVLGAEWWLPVEGAYWSRPEGPRSSLDSGFGPYEGVNRWDHPVVHVTWHDAREYCKWAGGRLPTEAEWEFAARDGFESSLFPWGDSEEERVNGKTRLNIWHGSFPRHNTLDDGWFGTAPSNSLPPQTKTGLNHMVGNVWEWTADWFTATPCARRACRASGTLDPKGPEKGAAKVMKGGSFMCHASYCYRYRNSARSQNTPDSSSSNLGFRCAWDA